jgi:hypothetical protein
LKLEPGKHYFPIDGVEVWRNPKNEFIVFQCHYTANPLKRDPSWRQRAKSGLSLRKWKQEYEISWESYAGKPVYPDFSLKLHTSATTLEPEPGLPLLRGWDFGLTPAAIICQLQGRQLVVLREYVSSNMGIQRFAREVVLPGCAREFPNWADQENDWLNFIDPAGLAKAQTDERSCADLMFDSGIKSIYPGAITWEERRDSVETLLARFFRRGQAALPAILISRPECPVIVEGFQGGYQYPERVMEDEPEKIRPIKNRFSHPHDGLQMVTSMIGLIQRKDFHSMRIPAPAYFGSRG